MSVIHKGIFLTFAIITETIASYVRIVNKPTGRCYFWLQCDMTDLLWQQLNLNVQLTLKVSLWLSSIYFFPMQSLSTSLTHCNVLQWLQLRKSYSRLTWLLSAKSFVTCTRAEASLSILAWARSTGESMTLRIVLVFIGVLVDYKPSGFTLTWWGLQSLSQAKDVSWFSGWSKGCPVST